MLLQPFRRRYPNARLGRTREDVARTLELLSWSAPVAATSTAAASAPSAVAAPAEPVELAAAFVQPAAAVASIPAAEPAAASAPVAAAGVMVLLSDAQAPTRRLHKQLGRMWKNTLRLQRAASKKEARCRSALGEFLLMFKCQIT